MGISDYSNLTLYDESILRILEMLIYFYCPQSIKSIIIYPQNLSGLERSTKASVAGMEELLKEWKARMATLVIPA